MEANATTTKKRKPWLMGAGVLFAAWNTALAVDTAHLVYQLNNENKFEQALPLRLAEHFKTNTEFGGTQTGATTINAVSLTASALGAPGVVIGHTAGIILFDWD